MRMDRPDRRASAWVLPLLWGLRGYQRWISPLLGPRCRFSPTCSHYAVHCLCEHGLVRGGWLSLRRVARCHPFHAGGYDPPPLADGSADRQAKEDAPDTFGVEPRVHVTETDNGT